MVGLRIISLALALLAAVASRPAAAGPPKRPAPAAGELSLQGTRHGELEFALGSVMAAIGIGLATFGAIELVRTRAHAQYCAQAVAGSGIDSCRFDPPALGYAAVGLSWGFSVPLLVGSGLLFARGARVLDDARRVVRPTVRPVGWWGRTGAGLSLSLRF